MPNVIVDAEVAAVTAAEGAMDSATALIGTINQKIADAVAAAIANGATADQLAPLTALQAELAAKTQALAAAVAANS